MESYALVILGTAVLALLLMFLRRGKFGLKPATVFIFGALATVLCVLAGRAAFWLCQLDWITDSDLSFWDFLGSGYHYMLYGAVAGGFAAAILTRLITRQPFGKIADAAAAPAALLIAAGRFAEYLIEAGFGNDIEEWFSPFEDWSMIAWENPEAICRFPFAIRTYYGWRFSINLWEGLAALVFVIVLLRLAKRRSGGAATLLILMYACCQVLFESMRRDEVIIWGFVKANQLISAVLILGITVFCWLRLPKQERKAWRLILHVGVMLLFAGVAMLMEFALDQKISFLMWMRADMSFIVLGLCCAGMLLNALPLWKKAWPKTAA